MDKKEIEKLHIKIKVKALETYIKEFERLEKEYNKIPRIPIYYFFKAMSISKKMSELTTNYKINFLDQNYGK